VIGSTAGRLLVALPALADPNFERTVVLVLDHDDEGALGLVLNRPTLTAVADVLTGWGSVVTAPTLVFGGGPVEPQAVVGLALARPGHEPPETIGGRIRTVDPTADPAQVATEVVGARLFAGYAGWAPGQLEDEIAEGAWTVVDAEPEDVVATDPERLWSAVLARQPGSLRLLASFPEDPALN
jgi:putative transcriptional regulator